MGTCCSTLNCNEGNISLTDRAKEKTLEAPKCQSKSHQKSPSDVNSIQKRTPSLIPDQSDSFQSPQQLSLPNLNYCKCGALIHFSQSWLALFPNFNKSCEICKRYNFKSFFLCNQCNNLICNFCATMLGYSINFIYCENNHKLKFYSDTAVYYNEKKKQKFFQCRNCKANKIGPSWSCRSCMFDLCVDCARLEGVFSPFSGLKCCMQHELQYKVLQVKEVKDFQCFECFRSKGKGRERLYCDECEFCYCVWCSILKIGKDFEVIRCGKGHRLEICSIFKLPKGGEWVLCAGCSLATMDLAYNCVECRVWFCVDCYDGMVSAKGKFRGRTCRCGGVLEFSLCDGRGFSCWVCVDELECARFGCVGCGKSVCLDCISLL